MYTTRIVTSGPAGVMEAAKLLNEGHIVAMPTETVYGLCANVYDETAVQKIFDAKGRPSDNPMIVHISDVEQLDDLVVEVSDNAKILMDEFWPGPLTLIMKKSKNVSDIVTAGLDTVAVRMPMHHIAKMFIECCGCPIAAPSANRSGRPSPTNAQEVFDDMESRIPMIIDGGPCQYGIESTVVDVTISPSNILRPGTVTKEMIAEFIEDVTVDETALDKAEQKDEPKSPGLKYRHYAPKAGMLIVEGADVAVSRYICKQMMKDRMENIRSVVLCYKENKRAYGGEKIIMGSKYRPESVAETLFNSLRDIDYYKYEMAYVEAMDTTGLGLAIMNRLLKAAGYNKIEVD